ncbi:MAG: 8-amino-7-oxononanoate synthase [Planctomycetota bacterium]|nr:8-amino-7-oxononanoate synthase [Planctomycetota bacterium]
MTSLSWLPQALQDLTAKNLFRRLRPLASGSGPWVECRGKRYLNLASNNYLDLAGHPRLQEAVAKAVAKWGWGSGAAALISGWTEVHEALALRLAAFKGAEDCVLFPTGYQANLGALGLLQDGDLLILDKLCHASLVDGARLSGAALRVYPHGDLGKLRRLLAERAAAAQRCLVATDTIFSMDGDCAPLTEIADLCRAHGALLLADDAHGTGVVGASGAGVLETIWQKPAPGAAAGKLPPYVIGVATLSKAFGSSGGFVTASREICDYIRNRSRAFIYTTALPPAAAAASLAALEVMQTEPWRRQMALANARRFRLLLNEGGVPQRAGAERQPPFLVPGEAAIVSLVVGSAEAALRLAAILEQRGILCPAIRPPTVPEGGARIRLVPTAAHTPEDIDALLAALEKARQAV